MGCLLPPDNPKRRKAHIPILRKHVRKLGQLYHIFQPQSKIDREGRGKILIINPTNCMGCPVRALQELLLCPTDNIGRLFTVGEVTPTSDWFREWFRFWLHQVGIKNWQHYGVRSCRKGACSTATIAGMPEHFTDTLGDWKSRAKESYRRTTLGKAQKQFCTHLGGKKQKKISGKKFTKTVTPADIQSYMKWIHRSEAHRIEQRQPTATNQRIDNLGRGRASSTANIQKYME